jgi:stage II sporulation protein D
MLKQKNFLLSGGLFGALIFVITPSQAQMLKIRLFEIFHPQVLEISSGADHLANGLINKTNRYQAAKNLLIISPPPDTTNWVRLALTSKIWQMQSARFTRSLSLADTVSVAATDGYFFAMPHRRPNAEETTWPARRRYSGSIKIYVTGNELCVVNQTTVGDYLDGVLTAEMPNADLAALQAQAVVARTYMIKNWRRHEKSGYQFCDLTHCQAYKGSDGVTTKIQRAVTSTTDEILIFDDCPIDAYYSSTCGGATADDAGIWANSKDQPYLKSMVDSINCAASPHFRWQTRMSIASLHQIWQRHVGEPVSSIFLTKKGKDGRVRELAILGGSLHLVSGEDFRAITCRELGWNTIKSTAFNLSIDKNDYVLSGRGLGHGIGLCQYGAIEMARHGFSYQKILQHYFPETKIQPDKNF